MSDIITSNEYSNFYFPEFKVKIGTKELYPRNVSYKVSATTEKLKTLERPWFDVAVEQTEEIIIVGNINTDEISDYKTLINNNSGKVITVKISEQVFEDMYIKNAVLDMQQNTFYFEYKITFVKMNFETQEVEE